MDINEMNSLEYDLAAYLQYNEDIYRAEDVKTIHAEVPGHNDEDSWFWVIELHDGRFMLTEASCDYTGWDCDSSGSSVVAASAEAAALLAPEESYGRRIQEHLLAQLRGTQPFGVEVISFKDDA